jgi:hypothetical protein
MNDHARQADPKSSSVGALIVKVWDAIPLVAQSELLGRLDERVRQELRELLCANGVTWIPQAVRR